MENNLIITGICLKLILPLLKLIFQTVSYIVNPWVAWVIIREPGLEPSEAPVDLGGPSAPIRMQQTSPRGDETCHLGRILEVSNSRRPETNWAPRCPGSIRVPKHRVLGPGRPFHRGFFHGRWCKFIIPTVPTEIGTNCGPSSGYCEPSEGPAMCMEGYCFCGVAELRAKVLNPNVDWLLLSHKKT